MYKGYSVRLMADFLPETVEARRQGYDIVKEKNSIGQQVYIWQNYDSKIKEKLKYSQIKRN